MVWLNLIIIATIAFSLNVAVRVILKKAFNIEKTKKEILSNYINSLHKKIDWAIRITTMIILLICLYLIAYKNLSINFFLTAMIFTFGTESAVRAFFEWKYTENPKQSIITAGETVILVFVLLATIQFDLLVA